VLNTVSGRDDITLPLTAMVTWVAMSSPL